MFTHEKYSLHQEINAPLRCCEKTKATIKFQICLSKVIPTCNDYTLKIEKVVKVTYHLGGSQAKDTNS